MAEATPMNAGVTDMAAPAVSAFTAVTVLPQNAFSEVRIPGEAYTLQGFRRWLLSEEAPERGRFTFVSGELIADMSPESYEHHNAVKVEITSVLHRLVRQKKLGRIFGDRILVSNPGAGLSTEPDATFATFQSLQSGRCQLIKSNRPGVAEELTGSPDWVLEIVSRTSVRKDTVQLREAYHRAGVGEYWLIDVQGEEIAFHLLLRQETGYAEGTAEDSWVASLAFGRRFRLTREMDQDGMWQYTLEMKDNGNA
jgi:Uma2 family endonuclease